MSSSVLRPPVNQRPVLVQVEVSDVPFVIGYLSNFGLLGILSIQAYIYARHFRRDPGFLRSTVLVVFCLEVFNSILVMYSAIFGAHIRCLSCLITGHRDYVSNGVRMSETISTWAFQTLCLVTGLSSSIVQMFFAWRIWVLGKSVWIPAVIVVVSLAQCVLLMIGGILSSTDPNLGVFDTNGAVVWLIISAVCDILITVRTAQLLCQSRDDSNCQATQSLILKLIKMSIETGLVTVIATLLEFAIARTLNIAHHGVFYSLSKLYANCLLATLNARLAICGEAKFDPSATGFFSPAIFSPAGEVPRSPAADALYEIRLGLYKTQSAPVSAPRHRDPLSASVPAPPIRHYHSIGVQSGVDTHTHNEHENGHGHERRRDTAS